MKFTQTITICKVNLVSICNDNNTAVMGNILLSFLCFWFYGDNQQRLMLGNRNFIDNEIV
jgi:hypothetical protein